MGTEPFPCTSCGECCKRTAFLSDEVLASVGLSRGPEGWCSEFKGGQCAVYETRPSMCRVPPEHYELSAVICNIWMQEAGWSGPFIDIERLKH